jgi:formylglycine-generating enzyme
VSRARTIALVPLAVTLVACAPNTAPAPAQLLLYLDTDAPLPSGSSASPDALAPAPLFNRVRFDVVRGEGTSACDCSEEFDVTQDLVMSGAASFGVLPPLAGDGAIRVRLFRDTAIVQGEPDPGSTIDMTFALPAAPTNGAADYTLFLPTDVVGVPQGTTTPLTPRAGRPNPAHVGTWAGAKRTPCASPAREGEVCVPGGAFWMGNVAVPNQGPGSGNVSRLVVLSPYFIDATEVTVAAYRTGGGQIGFPWSGTVSCDLTDYCTYTPAPGPNDMLPVTCMIWQQARSFCQSQGKDLPTEAEFEYVAGGLASQPYVWGRDVPQCGDAVFGRGGLGSYAGYPSQCISLGSGQQCEGSPPGGVGYGGPLPPMSGALDRLTIAFSGFEGTVYDLDGNVAEFARDRWDLETGPCWSRPGVYANPLCTDPASSEFVVGAGDWAEAPADLLAAQRSASVSFGGGPEYGFRCVRE